MNENVYQISNDGKLLASQCTTRDPPWAWLGGWNNLSLCHLRLLPFPKSESLRHLWAVLADGWSPLVPCISHDLTFLDLIKWQMNWKNNPGYLPRGLFRSLDLVVRAFRSLGMPNIPYLDRLAARQVHLLRRTLSSTLNLRTEMHTWNDYEVFIGLSRKHYPAAWSNEAKSWLLWSSLIAWSFAAVSKTSSFSNRPFTSRTCFFFFSCKTYQHGE